MLSYNQLNNYFTQLPDAYKKDCIVMTTKNIGKQKQLALDLIYNKTSHLVVGCKYKHRCLLLYQPS